MTIVSLDPNEVLPERSNYDTAIERDPSFGDLTSAAFKSDNVLYNVVNQISQPKNLPDPQYDVFKDLGGYEGYADRFIGAESQADSDQIKKRIDQETESKTTIASGGLEGVAASIAAGFADPTMYIPIGGELWKTYRTGGKILEGAARTGLAMGAITAGNELALHSLQETRTGAESMANVAGATFLGGVMGGAIHSLGGHAAVANLAERVENELTVPTSSVQGEVASAGEASQPTPSMPGGNPDILGTDTSVTANPSGSSSVGAMSTDRTTLSDEALKSAGGLEKLFAFQDPTLRMANSPSKTSRQFIEALAESPLSRNKNVPTEARDAIASPVSVENRIRSYDLPKYQYMQEFDKQFLDYRGNSSKLATNVSDKANSVIDSVFRRSREDGMMTEHEFGTEVVKAGRRNDEHEIPQVAAAAKAKRALITDPLFQRAKDVGLIDPEVTGPKTADSYVNRVWDKQKIENDRENFQAINEQHLRNKRDNAASAVQEKLANFNLQDGPIAETFKQVKQEYRDSASDRAAMQRKAEATGKTIDTTTGNIDDIHTALDQQTKNQQRLMEKILNGRDRGDEDMSDLFNEFKSVSSSKRELFRRLDHHEGVLEEKNAKYERRKGLADQLEGFERDLEEKVNALEKQHGDIADLQHRAGFDDAELKNVAYQLVDRILGTPAGRLSYDNKIPGAKNAGKAARRGPAKARVYDIPDEMVEKYLVNDDHVLTESYVRSLASDIELMKTFGSIDPEDSLKKIQDDYARVEESTAQHLRDNGKEGEIADTLRKLRKAKNNDIRDFQGVWERLRGTYGQSGDDYGTPLRSAERIAMSANYMANLGGMTISAFTDVGRPVMVHGLERTMNDAIIPMITEFKNYRLASRDVKETGTALDMVLNTRGRALMGMDEYQPMMNRMEAVTGHMQHNFGIISLMAPWNAAIKQFSGVITQSRMLRGVLDIAAGKELKPAESEYLAANFIDKSMASRIADQFNKYGVKTEKVHIPNVRTWDDNEAAETFRAAVRRDVNRTIVEPGQDKPLWMSKPGLKLIGQFRSFSIASLQRTTLAGLQQRDAAVLNGTILSTILGMGVYTLKSESGGYTPDFSPGNMIAEGVDRSGVLAWMMDASNMAEKVSRGRIGVHALLGGPPMSRYASRSALESIFGPTYGMIGNLVQLSGNAFAGDWQAADTHTLRRLMPYQNLFYLRSIFDEAEEGINSSLGVEGRK